MCEKLPAYWRGLLVRTGGPLIIDRGPKLLLPLPLIKSSSRAVDRPVGSIVDLIKSSRVRLSARDSDLTVALTADDGGLSIV